jgi:hypothetical protein
VTHNIQMRVTTSRNSHFTRFICNSRPRSARADSGARRVGDAARPRDCRALRAALPWGGGLCAAAVEAIRASRLAPSPAVPSSPPTPSVSTAKPPNAPSAAAAPDRRPPFSRPPLRPPVSLPGSSQTFRRSSQSSAGVGLGCCGAAAAMASARLTFTAAATATRRP